MVEVPELLAVGQGTSSGREGVGGCGFPGRGRAHCPRGAVRSGLAGARPERHCPVVGGMCVAVISSPEEMKVETIHM